ncbi:hypothetical protein SUGI_0887190 [Cryptomeria japonica]|nr:hypothetical protein SUGI_0887190 [Cryptomeria japonica]
MGGRGRLFYSNQSSLDFLISYILAGNCFKTVFDMPVPHVRLKYASSIFCLHYLGCFYTMREDFLVIIQRAAYARLDKHAM